MIKDHTADLTGKLNFGAAHAHDSAKRREGALIAIFIEPSENGQAEHVNVVADQDFLDQREAFAAVMKRGQPLTPGLHPQGLDRPC
jgi:hypothetical protein